MSRTLAEFRRLDNPASVTPLYIWWANQVGHFFLGMVACVAVGPWFAVLPYTGKELALDLRAGRSVRQVAADLLRGKRSKHWRDSITDISFWSLGAGAGAHDPGSLVYWLFCALLAVGLVTGAERGWDGGD